jgi:chromosomal replication initiation ATPase DnaA
VCTDERAAAVWSRVTAKLAERMNPHVLATWFGEAVITPVRLDGRRLVISAANQVVKEWVSSNYANELRAALNEAAGKKSELEVVWQVSEDE